MMHNFKYDIPTKVYFGEGAISNLTDAVKEYGTKVLLAYGGGSIKKNGLYDTVTGLLEKAGIEYWELSGIEANPRITTAAKGAEICREHGIEVILPVGGGSAIDCAKAVACLVKYDGDPWNVVVDRKLADSLEVLPIITVLTMAATGSEMDNFSMINNDATNDKKGIGCYQIYPKVSILDPTYSYTVPKRQTAAGTADIMSHIFEVYFNNYGGTNMQDHIMEALLKTLVECGPVAYNEPDNYDARANLMWTSSWAINGFIACGKAGAWPVHAMEHQLSAYYDVTHGEGLAVLTPHWMRFALNDTTVDLFASYGKNVFGINGDMDRYEIAKKAIDKTAEFFYETLHMPKTLKELGIPDKSLFDEMAGKAYDGGIGSCFVPVMKEDVLNIYNACFE